MVDTAFSNPQDFFAAGGAQDFSNVQNLNQGQSATGQFYKYNNSPTVFLNGSFAPPNTASPVPTSQITGANLNLPPASPKTTDPSAFMNSLGAANPTPPATASSTPSFDLATTGDYTKDSQYNQALGQYNTSVGDFTTAANALPSQYDLTKSAYATGGVNTDMQKVKDLQTQLAQVTSQYNNASQNSEVHGIQNGVAGVFYQGEQAAIQRQQAVVAGGISTQLAAAQGNYALSKQLADQTVQLQFEDAQAKIDNKLKFVQLNQDNLSNAEKLVASKMQAQAKQQQVELDKQKENRALALQSGASTKFINKNGEFFSTADGKSYTDPAAFFAAAGVSSFDEAYQKGLVTDVTAKTLADRDLVSQMAAKYGDAGINPADSLETATAKLKKSRIYADQVRGPVGSGTSSGVVAGNDAITQSLLTTAGGDGKVDPQAYLRVRAAAKMTPKDFDDRYGYLLSNTEQRSLGVTSTKPATDTQNQAATYANRVQQSGETIDKLATDISKYNSVGYYLEQKSPNSLQSPAIQQYNQASKNLINSILRRESGAAISQSEFDNAYEQYLPKPGDSQAVIAQKKQNRDTVLNGLINSAGPAYTSSSSNNNSNTTVLIGPDGNRYNVPNDQVDAFIKAGGHR